MDRRASHRPRHGPCGLGNHLRPPSRGTADCAPGLQHGEQSLHANVPAPMFAEFEIIAHAWAMGENILIIDNPRLSRVFNP